MALSTHIRADDVLKASEEHPHRSLLKHAHDPTTYKLSPIYGLEDIPKYTLPRKGLPQQHAYQLIHDEMAMDCAPVLNLASFVNTGMDEFADKLMAENVSKNLVDHEEYPATQAIHARCISILADLWKVPKGCHAVGTATTGSSEAIQLAGLAMKKRWQEKMKKAGKDIHNPGPNIVFGANAQVALEKFARYFDVEARLVPVSVESQFVMDPKEAIEYIDENTIGVMVILGSTYTGGFEDVKGMNDLLDDLQARKGIDIPIHVDAASGGFVAPFAYPDYDWAFSISRVNSINSSGHKFGMTYAGLGWLLFKDKSLLHKDLVFELHYLGSAQSSYTLNFSRPAAPVLGQMYRFLSLGREGFTKIVHAELANARLFSNALSKSYFTILSSIHLPVHHSTASTDTPASHVADSNVENPLKFVKGLPVVSFRLSDEFKEKYPHVQQRWIQHLLRVKGWIVPNYTAPKSVDNIEMLRVVVRVTMSADLIQQLVSDILEITESLMELGSDNHVMMALQENVAKPAEDTNSPTDPIQHEDAPADTHSTHAKHVHHNARTGHGWTHGRVKIEAIMGTHRREDGGTEQFGYGRVC